ncbi:MAG TPA: adenosylhomocysteinase, partial [Acidobacteriota bacterium]|nr:adenosylhomocysteinase [Acidobacteriota bacterium]
MTHFPTFSSQEFQRDLAWARRHMTLTQGQATQLPDLSPVRLAVSAHLDLKTILAIEAVLDHSGSVFLTTCNPTTVRNHVVEYLKSRGAQAHAWNGMSLQDQAEAIEQVLAWNPTHLCEMGADLSGAIIERGLHTQVKAGLEATGSGISRLTRLQSAGNTFTFPIFNWDDLPIKEGLHNRHLVGLTTWHTFTERTRLSLHLKRVLVVGD